MLPPELPTSVEGSYGYIRYIVRVVLDFRLHPEMIFEEPFTVIKMINLNDEPALRVIKHFFHPCNRFDLVQALIILSLTETNCLREK